MLYDQIKNSSHKQLVVLIDPDKQNEHSLLHLIELAKNARVDFFFVGGSLLLENYQHLNILD